MKDFLGQDVKIGDRVVYITTHMHRIFWRVGIITKITPFRYYEVGPEILRAAIRPDKIESQKYCREVVRYEEEFTRYD